MQSRSHLLAGLLRAVICAENKWFYTAEKDLNEYIDYASLHKNEVIAATAYLDSIPGTNPEQRFYELRSLGYVMRGYVKEKSDREDEAEEDYKKFTDDFEKADVRNKELSFFAAYTCIKNGDNERAERFLQRMEKSPGYGEDDKKTVAELRSFLKEKDGDKFNKYMDSFSLYKIVFSYLYGTARNSEMAKSLMKNERTRTLVEMPSKVNNVINYSGNIMNTDSLTSKAGSFVKNLFK